MTPNAITKSDFTKRLAQKHDMSPAAANTMVNVIIKTMSEELHKHKRIEIRGFGSFETRHRAQQQARNPKNGEIVTTAAHFVVHFKPSKEMRQRINVSAKKQ